MQVSFLGDIKIVLGNEDDRKLVAGLCLVVLLK